MIVVPITKRMDIIMSMQVCPISPININYEENNGEKLFLPNKNFNIIYPYMENMIVVPNHKKIGDYYENPSLTHFTDKH